MKKFSKYLFAAIASMAIFISLPFNAAAELMDETLPRVVDNADLLTEKEETTLENNIKTITDKYDFDIVLVTADTLDGKTPMEYSDDFFDYEGYGAGVNRDGVLLLVSMEERDWWISTRGYGIKVFTDYGIQKAGDAFVSYLSDAKYAEGFESFLNITEDYITEAKKGNPFVTNNKYLAPSEQKKYIIISIVGSFGIALIAALITVFIFRSQLKSVKFQGGAAHYEVAGSMNVTRSNDVFLYRNVTRSKRVESDGGGSSTHSSSSGASHGGGGGKF